MNSNWSLASGKSFYIDTIYFKSNSGSVYTGQTTPISSIADSSFGSGSANKGEGYQWVAQIVNATDASITLNSTDKKIILNSCTNYYGSDFSSHGKDIFIVVTSGTIASGGSIYLGFSNLGATIASTGVTVHVDTYNGSTFNSDSTEYYMPNKDNTFCSRFLLWYGSDAGTIQDIVGNSSYNSTTLTSYLTNGDGLYSRDAGDSLTVPVTSYSHNDWVATSTTDTDVRNAHLTATGYGDPHVTTLTGQHYDFDYIGYMRYFDNNNPNNRLVINVQCEKSKYTRWKENSYYTKVFIKHNEKTMVLDLGFRGNPVKVLENNGFEYNEVQLPLDKEAKQYCAICPRWGRKQLDRVELHKNTYNHEVLGAVRNGISIQIETEQSTYDLKFQNVNKHNLQPARIFMKPNNINGMLLNRYQGLVVDRKWAPYSMINSLDNIDVLDTSKETAYEIPKDVTPCQEINPMYY